jgi:hypothetical protein
LHIDWLTIEQTHRDPVPRHGSDLVLRTDLETGEIVQETVWGYQHEGSHDSTLRVRSDGFRVEVSGNPSRWGRRDALDGLTDVDAAVEVYNGILRGLGLPEFGVDARTYAAGGQLQSGDYASIDRLRIKRIDWCQNYATGKGNEARALRALAVGRLSNRPGHLYADGCTVDWYRGSRRLYVKYYAKAQELAKQAKRRGIDLDQQAHLTGLANWCRDHGIIRHELTIKAQELTRLGLDHPAAWSIDKANELMNVYALHNRATAAASDLHDIRPELSTWLEDHPSERLTDSAMGRLQMSVDRWMSGQAPTDCLPRSTGYRYRRILMQACGIDIRTPFDVTAMAVRVRTLEVVPVQSHQYPKAA